MWRAIRRTEWIGSHHMLGFATMFDASTRIICFANSIHEGVPGHLWCGIHLCTAYGSTEHGKPDVLPQSCGILCSNVQTKITYAAPAGNER